MKHGVKINRLGRNASHRKAMLSNLATSVLRQGLAEDQMSRAVRTTVAKAKTVKPLVERLISFGKKGDLTARRQAAKVVHDHEVLKALFEKLAPRYAGRTGGYTRVLKLDRERAGDNAEMAIISLVEDEVAKKAPKAKAKVSKKLDITEASN